MKGDFYMSSYTELKKRHQKEVNAFPMFFAFSDEQFVEGMRKLGRAPSETDKVYRTWAGGFYQKSDAPARREMLDRHEREHQNAIAADKIRNGYIFEMFYYEMANHEYGFLFLIISLRNLKHFYGFLNFLLLFSVYFFG